MLQARAAAMPPQQPKVNLTDPDSRLMPNPQCGYLQGYNAQLAVEAQGVIVGQAVSQASNDRTALASSAATLQVERGEMAYLVTDQGDDNQAQIEEVEAALDTTVICAPQTTARLPGVRQRPER